MQANHVRGSFQRFAGAWKGAAEAMLDGVDRTASGNERTGDCSSLIQVKDLRDGPHLVVRMSSLGNLEEAGHLILPALVDFGCGHACQ
jgi:hypothetical protein